MVETGGERNNWFARIITHRAVARVVVEEDYVNSVAETTARYLIPREFVTGQRPDLETFSFGSRRETDRRWEETAARRRKKERGRRARRERAKT